jgi:predicted 3-demethylubiquinone-9 3-methyltransferase (glyoxalase superfamily)
MSSSLKIVPCLWFDTEAEQAANAYAAIFANSRVTKVTHYPEAGTEIHGRAAGSVMTVSVELDGQPFTALNGGPAFKFNEAISFEVHCDDQDEIDYYWDKLGEGGDERARQCGWLKDRFGVSWQVVPRILLEMIDADDPSAMERAFAAMLKMKKLDIAELKRAYEG